MKPFAPVVLRFESLPSTNTEAARQAMAGAAEGLCITAKEQTAGRGRFDRVWASPKDAGLYLSIVLRPTLDQRSWPLITLATSLSVSAALEQACAITTDIKWPNDIMHSERKLCGILAETVDTEYGRALILGIGINLTSQAFPQELNGTATSVEAAAGRRPDADALLSALVNSFGSYYQRLQATDGVAKTIADWSAHSSYAAGRQVRVIEAGGTFVGTTRGLESDGALRVETVAGAISILHAGEVQSLRSTDDPLLNSRNGQQNT